MEKRHAMIMDKVKYFSACVLLFLSCNKSDAPETNTFSKDHLEYFGFTIVDTYWDDPTDSDSKTNYMDEVYPFSNLADILVIFPEDDLNARIHAFSERDMKAILHLNELFFEIVDNNSPSGVNYDLRPNYAERWKSFLERNSTTLTSEFIGALYIGEEPTWNGISYNEMNQVSALMQRDLPSIPTLLIEAYPAVKDLRIPKEVDWIGFDHYFVKDPLQNEEYRNEWLVLNSKISDPEQRILVIMDTHYIDWAHGDHGGIALQEMDVVAKNYYKLAQSDSTVVGILGYFWPNGFDIPESIGARGMPGHVLETYEKIGKEISEKD